MRAFKTSVAKQFLQRQRLYTAVKPAHRVAVAERVRGEEDRKTGFWMSRPGSVWRSEIIVRLAHYLTIPTRKGLI